MKSVIIDTSSAILLNKSNMLTALLKDCMVVIPGAVYAELTVPGHSGSELFTDLCRKNSITVMEPHETENIGKNTSLHAGERGVISLFYEGAGDFVIIDDGRGGAFCRDNNIPYINALLAVKIFFIKHLITEREYNDAWSWLLENGRYSQHVIVRAEHFDEHGLTVFL